MIGDIQARWNSWDPADQRNAHEYAGLARAAIDYGHYPFAQQIVEVALKRHPGAHTLQYLQALACSRSLNQCMPLLERMLEDRALPDTTRADVLALEGKLYKNQCQSTTGTLQVQAAHNSAQRYAAAMELAGSRSQRSFLAINAASMSLLAGDVAQVAHYASDAMEASASPFAGSDDYWRMATLGEASLLLNDEPAAANWYQQAHAAAGERFGSIGSMRAQLRLLSGRRNVEPLLQDVLKIPRVAAFTGHMIDQPDTASPRFPACLEAEVATGIGAAIARHDARFGYCSAACGGDLLFAEQMLERDAEVNITLPFNVDDFLQTSVRHAGSNWEQRFHKVMKEAASVRLATTEAYLGDVILFDYTNRLFLGNAILRARQMATTPLLIAALQPGSAASTGGTAMAVGFWQSLGLPCELVEIRPQQAGPVIPPAQSTQPASQESQEAGARGRKIRTMLFADVTGFSRIGEADALVFVEQFLGAAAQLLKTFVPAPMFVNTWGDGIYMVFETIEAGADFALRLRDLVNETDWASKGLPDHTGIRIALHCGPVFPAMEPMTERQNFFGTHVTRAARIEPVTTPGTTCLTEQAAALLVSGGDKRFQCDDLGSVELAKKYGAEQLFRLRRCGEWE